MCLPLRLLLVVVLMIAGLSNAAPPSPFVSSSRCLEHCRRSSKSEDHATGSFKLKCGMVRRGDQCGEHCKDHCAPEECVSEGQMIRCPASSIENDRLKENAAGEHQRKITIIIWTVVGIFIVLVTAAVIVAGYRVVSVRRRRQRRRAAPARAHIVPTIVIVAPPDSPEGGEENNDPHEDTEEVPLLAA